MCDQQSRRAACTYVQTEQSLCLSLEFSMSVKLLTEHHLEFLSLKWGYTGLSESTLVKNAIFLEITCRDSYGPPREKTCLLGIANNKGTDQPAHTCRLICAFVICVLESIISKLAASEIFNF